MLLKDKVKKMKKEKIKKMLIPAVGLALFVVVVNPAF